MVRGDLPPAPPALPHLSLSPNLPEQSDDSVPSLTYTKTVCSQNVLCIPYVGLSRVVADSASDMMQIEPSYFSASDLVRLSLSIGSVL